MESLLLSKALELYASTATWEIVRQFGENCVKIKKL
jgi:hypothetical protein